MLGRETVSRCGVLTATGTAMAVLVVGSVGCGPGGPFGVGGTATGLSGALVLQNNGRDNLTLTADGQFEFPTQAYAGDPYAVTVLTQPWALECTVINGTGVVGADTVVDIAVTCGPVGYSVAVTVAELVGTLILQNNGTDDLTITENRMHVFSTGVSHGSSYDVTVLQQPVGHTCVVTNGSGIIEGAHVTDVSVGCTINIYRVGGTVSNLNGSVGLHADWGEDLTLSQNGSFQFATAREHATTYEITVTASPRGNTCTVTNSSGTINGAAITDVAVSCSVNSYSVGGTVGGLLAGTVVLRNNGADDLAVDPWGLFVFPTLCLHGAAYDVTVLTQPVGYACTVTNGSGSIDAADVVDVTVSCVPENYGVGGTLSGLVAGALFLQNNGGDNLRLTQDGSFQFATLLPQTSTYDVTVLAPPSGYTCTVQNGSGTINGADVTGVIVTCASSAYVVGGTLYGFDVVVVGNSGSLILQNNGGDDLTLTQDGTFAFPTPLAEAASYSVTVQSEPTGFACTVQNASGTVAGADVINVIVDCVGPCGVTPVMRYLGTTSSWDLWSPTEVLYQTFVPGVGSLDAIAVKLWEPNGELGAHTLELVKDTGVSHGGAVVASWSVDVPADPAKVYLVCLYAAGTALVSADQYSIRLHPAANTSSSDYIRWLTIFGAPYAAGACWFYGDAGAGAQWYDKSADFTATFGVY